MNSLVGVVQTIEELNGWSKIDGLHVDQLEKRFGLTRTDAVTLWYLAMSYCNRTINPYHLPKGQNDQFVDAVLEEVHMSFEGWSEHDSYVIEAFLASVRYCMSLDDQV